MHVAPFHSTLLGSATLMLAACGSGGGESADPGSDDQPPPVQQAEVLKISSRTYLGGNTKTKVSGFFKVDGSQELNKPASITDDGHTWLQYGVSGAQDLNVLFTNDEGLAENGVTIGVGPYTVTATSTSGECRTTFDITPATVSGHFSCTGSTGYNKDNGQMGKVDIEVEFNASS